MEGLLDTFGGEVAVQQVAELGAGEPVWGAGKRGVDLFGDRGDQGPISGPITPFGLMLAVPLADLDTKVDPRDLRRGGAEHFRRHSIRPLPQGADRFRTENRSYAARRRRAFCTDGSDIFAFASGRARRSTLGYRSPAATASSSQHHYATAAPLKRHKTPPQPKPGFPHETSRRAKTVKTHINRIFYKTARAETSAHAYQHRLT